MTEVPNIAGMYHIEIPQICVSLDCKMRIDQEGDGISITTFFDSFYTILSGGILYEKDGLWYGFGRFELANLEKKTITLNIKMSDISDHKIASCYCYCYENASIFVKTKMHFTLLQKETYKFPWEL
jgi:hypothetical protein